MTFPPDAVAAICRHMNDDHAAEALLICRTLGGAGAATSAEAVGVDGTGMRFQVQSGDGTSSELEVAFAQPVHERAQVRLAVVELYERARAHAGAAARD